MESKTLADLSGHIFDKIEEACMDFATQNKPADNDELYRIGIVKLAARNGVAYDAVVGCHIKPSVVNELSKEKH